MTSATRALSAAVDGDRLLAERRQAALDGGQRQRRVGRGGGRDHHAVDSGGQQRLDRIHRRGTVLGGHLLDHVGPLVGDHQAVELRQVGQRLGVEGADAAESDQAECGHGILRSFWARSAMSSCSGGGSRTRVRSSTSVHLAWRCEAADRLVAVEVGREGVALGGGDHALSRSRAGRPAACMARSAG